MISTLICVFVESRRPVYNPQYSADYPDFSPKKRKQSPPDQNSKVLIFDYKKKKLASSFLVTLHVKNHIPDPKR